MKKKTLAMSATNKGSPISVSSWSRSQHSHLQLKDPGTYRLYWLLADQGCRQNQRELAKKLLNDSDTDYCEQYRQRELAIYWLLKAANQGDKEGFELLKQCSQAGLGINAKNIAEIKACLRLSEEALTARSVAYGIYQLTMTDTDTVIPDETFQKKIDRIIEQKGQPDERGNSDVEDEEHHKKQSYVSFSDIVTSVHSCLEGSVPHVSLKQVDEYKQYIPSKYFCMLSNLVQRSLENFVQHLASFTLPFTMLLMYCVLNSMSYLTGRGSEMSMHVDKCKRFMVIAFCFSAMLSNSCYVIYNNFGNSNVKKWLEVIKFFEPTAKLEEAQKKSSPKAIFPLMTFLLISAMYVIFISDNSRKFSFGDFGIISIFLAVLVDRTIIHQRSYVTTSLIINSLLCVHKMGSLSTVSAENANSKGFNLTLDLDENSAYYFNYIMLWTLPFILTFLYVKMALGTGRKGWYMVLLPHFMSLIWMNLGGMYLSDNSFHYTLFTLCSWVILLVLSHYFGIFLPFTLYFFSKVFYVFSLTSEVTLFLVATFSICYLISFIFVRKISKSNERLFNLVLCFLVLVLSYRTINVNKPVDASDAVTDWATYEKYCYHRGWHHENAADMQISCLSLKGKKIRLEGTVTTVELTQVYNPVAYITSIIPNLFYDWFACTIGTNHNCESQTLTTLEKQHCILQEKFNLRECYLHNWNEYNYEVTVEISTWASPTVTLLFDNICFPFIRTLKDGDRVRVIGVLESRIGSSSPVFKTEQANCITCNTDVPCNIFRVMSQSHDVPSLQYFILIYFAPFINYMPKH